MKHTRTPWFRLNRFDDPQPPAPAPAGDPAPAADPAPAPATDPATDPAPEGDKPLGEAGEKALAEWKKRAKDAEKLAKDQAARLQEIDDAQKSELQRATEAAQRAADERDAALAEAARLRVISDTGLSPELAEFLPATGDEDQLREAAGKLNAALGDRTPPGPRPDPSQGARPRQPVDYRNAERGDFAAELAKHGLKTRSR